MQQVQVDSNLTFFNIQDGQWLVFSKVLKWFLILNKKHTDVTHYSKAILTDNIKISNPYAKPRTYLGMGALVQDEDLTMNDKR